MNTRMWIMETDQYGATGRQFYVDNPVNIPRQGSFIESDDVTGYVTLVQYNYRTGKQKIKDGEFGLVVDVFVSEEKT